MPFDLSILREAKSILKGPNPSPPGSVRANAIATHDILGGKGDGTGVFGKGYFLIWARGRTPVDVPFINDVVPVNTAVLHPPAVTVRDRDNRPIQGFPVRFTVTAGGGFLNGSANTKEVVVETNAEGVAAVESWTVGPTEGANAVVATGFAVDQTFTVTAVLDIEDDKAGR